MISWTEPQFSLCCIYLFISPKWAQYLNPRISDSNQTLLEALAVSAGAWNVPPSRSIAGPSNDRFGSVIEAVHAAMVTNGLSNLEPLASIQGVFPGDEPCSSSWLNPLMPQGSGSLVKGGMLWDVSGVDTTNMTKFTMIATSNGHAYSTRGGTTVAAMVLLLIYCVMLVFHTIYICRTSWSSSSWDTIPEVVALALQSKPTAMLENTGAEISTTNVFSSSIQILDVDGQVALTFRDTQDGGLLVKENEAYR
ncbi:hypothetical protein BKA56DRAFT_613982 [Ilyonectria sp. MPI-CAGE-AT-0026]|nr:hypothetical protein BKA56DRAFT_613982 [Ilyonectria sp. MPI-CAGE-AT-0026]